MTPFFSLLFFPFYLCIYLKFIMLGQELKGRIKGKNNISECVRATEQFLCAPIE